MLNTGFGGHGFEFIYENEFAAPNSPDEHWAYSFKRFGGQVVLSGDKNIAKRPHQIIAFKDNDLICFFCEARWASMDLPFKIAHIIYWWPNMQTRIGLSKPGDCWWVPMPIGPGEFRVAEVPIDVQANARKQAQSGGTLR
jgi:hypothetical protein